MGAVEKWDTVKLQDIAEFKTGNLNSNAAVVDGKYPFFTCSRETFKTNTWSFDCECVLLAGNNANAEYPVKYFKGKFDAYQRTYVITTKDPKVLNIRYLYYGVELKLNLLKSLSTGAATRFITKGIINNLEFNLPDVDEQNLIVNALAPYDSLIDNNNRRIAILEEMAQCLYREWFVKFRFPGHENTKFIDSQLGKIPEGWKVMSASEAIDINPRTIVPREGEKPFVPMSGLFESSMLIGDIHMRTGNSGAKFINGDTLFARITPCLENGKTGYVQFMDEENPVGFGSTEYIVLREKVLNSEIIYTLARSDSFRDHAIKSMTGASGRQRVQNSCFDSYMLPVPAKEILDEFREIIKPVYQKIYNLSNKNTDLKDQRTLILPKLMYGSIVVT